MIHIIVGDKQYKVEEAQWEDERRQGLQGVSHLPADEGMLFYFDPPYVASIWMKDTLIPLDIVFISDKTLKVLLVANGIPQSERIFKCKGAGYVLEVNAGSGILKGDLFDFLDNTPPVMKVLALDGTTLMPLWGGERIFSRIFTRQLVRLALKADAVKDDVEQYNRYCVRIGKKMFKELAAQDSRQPEYVEAPK